MQPSRRRAWLTHVAAFACGAVFAAAFGAHALPDSRARGGGDRYQTLDTFAQSLSYIANGYVDPVDERKLIYGAIRGMVRRLDRHSAFLSPDRYRRLRQDTEGEFGGVGLELARDDSAARGASAGDRPIHPIVAEVVPRSPAARAGIRVGDRVAAIDGVITDQRRVSDVRTWHTALRGLSGTRVTVRVWRQDPSRARDHELVRQRIKVPTVSWWEVEPGVGYIRIEKFQEATAADVAIALGALRGNGMRALILDLRNNPGGLLDQAIRVADLFLDGGLIVTVRGRTADSTEREHAHKPGTWSQFRMLALVDPGTASAAEIVAAALQDHDRAEILGTPTFGKGSIQTFLDLTDGSGLKLTTARFYSPSGRLLEGTGITPDILVEAFEAEVIEAGGEVIEADGEVIEAGGEVIGAGPEPGPQDEPEPAENSTRSREKQTLRERLADDRQFQAAHQTVRGWLESK